MARAGPLQRRMPPMNSWEQTKEGVAKPRAEFMDISMGNRNTPEV